MLSVLRCMYINDICLLYFIFVYFLILQGNSKDNTNGLMKLSHCVGRKLSDPTKPRLIVMKLVRHDVKTAIMRKGKILRERNPRIEVNEDLTKGRMMAIWKLKGQDQET